MARISKKVLAYRERQRRGAIMRPSTFGEIERGAARGGARDPEAVAGAAYWKTLAARYRGNPAALDRFTKQHLAKWLERFDHRDRAGMKKIILATIKQHPDLVPAGRSWPEILRMGEAGGMGANPADFVGEHRGVAMYFEGISYNAPSFKLYGYSTDLALKRAIDRKLKKGERMRSLRGGNPDYKKPKREFRDVRIGETFNFWDPWHSSMRGPWIKTAARGYVHASDPQGQKYRIGSISAKVLAPGQENPDDEELTKAAELYETFHGRAPHEVLQLHEDAEQRGEYTFLGELVELLIVSPEGDHVEVNFAKDEVRVASSPEGTQIYLLGGNQDISGSLGRFKVDESKDLIDLGEVKRLVYEAAKWQTDFKGEEWKHDFGEKSGMRPRAFYDQLKKRIFFAGGTYRVERPGIVD